MGLAVGDAFGAPVEFDDPARIVGRREALRLLPGGGPFGWSPGEFTDDTQMSVVLARCLVDGNFEQGILAVAFAEWAAHPGTADVGIQTRSVLSAVSSGMPWRQAVSALDSDAAGNGSLMRTAPVALVAASTTAAMRLARLQSEVTHPNRWCVDACAVFVAAVHAALDGGGLPELSALAALADEPEVVEAVMVSAADTPPQMSGFVLHTLTGALWAVYGAADFEDAIWRATSLGRDADTVAAVAGSLAGARWGRLGVPDDLAGRVTSAHPLFVGMHAGRLETLADDLIARRSSRQT